MVKTVTKYLNTATRTHFYSTGYTLLGAYTSTVALTTTNQTETLPAAGQRRYTVFDEVSQTDVIYYENHGSFFELNLASDLPTQFVITSANLVIYNKAANSKNTKIINTATYRKNLEDYRSNSEVDGTLVSGSTYTFPYTVKSDRLHAQILSNSTDNTSYTYTIDTTKANVLPTTGSRIARFLFIDNDYLTGNAFSTKTADFESYSYITPASSYVTYTYQSLPTITSVESSVLRSGTTANNALPSDTGSTITTLKINGTNLEDVTKVEVGTKVYLKSNNEVEVDPAGLFLRVNCPKASDAGITMGSNYEQNVDIKVTNLVGTATKTCKYTVLSSVTTIYNRNDVVPPVQTVWYPNRGQILKVVGTNFDLTSPNVYIGNTKINKTNISNTNTRFEFKLLNNVTVGANQTFAITNKDDLTTNPVYSISITAPTNPVLSYIHNSSGLITDPYSVGDKAPPSSASSYRTIATTLSGKGTNATSQDNIYIYGYDLNYSTSTSVTVGLYDPTTLKFSVAVLPSSWELLDDTNDTGYSRISFPSPTASDVGLGTSAGSRSVRFSRDGTNFIDNSLSMRWTLQPTFNYINGASTPYQTRTDTNVSLTLNEASTGSLNFIDKVSLVKIENSVITSVIDNIGTTNYVSPNLTLNSFSTADTLVFSSQPLTNETVTIDLSGGTTYVYKFVTSLVNSKDVLIGATLADSINNLRDAINNVVANNNITYKSAGNSNPYVSATAKATTLEVTKLYISNVVLSETLTNAYWRIIGNNSRFYIQTNNKREIYTSSIAIDVIDPPVLSNVSFSYFNINTPTDTNYNATGENVSWKLNYDISHSGTYKIWAFSTLDRSIADGILLDDNGNVPITGLVSKSLNFSYSKIPWLKEATNTTVYLHVQDISSGYYGAYQTITLRKDTRLPFYPKGIPSYGNSSQFQYSNEILSNNSSNPVEGPTGSYYVKFKPYVKALDVSHTFGVDYRYPDTDGVNNPPVLTSDIQITGITGNVGDYIVVIGGYGSYDTNSSTKGTRVNPFQNFITTDGSGNVTKTVFYDTSGNTYTALDNSIKKSTSPSTASYTQVSGVCLVSELKTSLPSDGTGKLTIPLSSLATNAATYLNKFAFQVWSVSPPVLYNYAGLEISVSNSSIVTSNISLSSSYDNTDIALAAVVSNRNLTGTSLSGDTDTFNGTWSTPQWATTNTYTGTVNYRDVSVFAQTKNVTATGTQTYNLTSFVTSSYPAAIIYELKIKTPIYTSNDASYTRYEITAIPQASNLTYKPSTYFVLVDNGSGFYTTQSVSSLVKSGTILAGDINQTDQSVNIIIPSSTDNFGSYSGTERTAYRYLRLSDGAGNWKESQFPVTITYQQNVLVTYDPKHSTDPTDPLYPFPKVLFNPTKTSNAQISINDVSSLTKIVPAGFLGKLSNPTIIYFIKNLSNSDTITLDNSVYTFVNTLSSNGQIKIGNTLSETINNIQDALSYNLTNKDITFKGTEENTDFRYSITSNSLSLTRIKNNSTVAINTQSAYIDKIISLSLSPIIISKTTSPTISGTSIINQIQLRSGETIFPSKSIYNTALIKITFSVLLGNIKPITESSTKVSFAQDLISINQSYLINGSSTVTASDIVYGQDISPIYSSGYSEIIYDLGELFTGTPKRIFLGNINVDIPQYVEDSFEIYNESFVTTGDIFFDTPYINRATLIFGDNPSADETVTIDKYGSSDFVYKFVVTPSVNNDVQIGTTLSESILNLSYAINNNTDYLVTKYLASGSNTYITAIANSTTLDVYKTTAGFSETEGIRFEETLDVDSYWKFYAPFLPEINLSLSSNVIGPVSAPILLGNLSLTPTSSIYISIQSRVVKYYNFITESFGKFSSNINKKIYFERFYSKNSPINISPIESIKISSSIKNLRFEGWRGIKKILDDVFSSGRRLVVNSSYINEENENVLPSLEILNRVDTKIFNPKFNKLEVGSFQTGDFDPKTQYSQILTENNYISSSSIEENNEIESMYRVYSIDSIPRIYIVKEFDTLSSICSSIGLGEDWYNNIYLPNKELIGEYDNSIENGNDPDILQLGWSLNYNQPYGQGIESLSIYAIDIEIVFTEALDTLAKNWDVLIESSRNFGVELNSIIENVQGIPSPSSNKNLYTLAFTFQPDSGDRLTINEYDYVFVNSLSPSYTSGEVLIGNTLFQTVYNLIDAINNNQETEGITYYYSLDNNPNLYVYAQPTNINPTNIDLIKLNESDVYLSTNDNIFVYTTYLYNSKIEILRLPNSTSNNLLATIPIEAKGYELVADPNLYETLIIDKNSYRTIAGRNVPINKVDFLIVRRRQGRMPLDSNGDPLIYWNRLPKER